MCRRGDFVVDLPHTTAGTVRATGSPIHFSRSAVRLDHAGPLLGEHTAEVLAEVGADAAAVERLAASGIVGVASMPVAKR